MILDPRGSASRVSCLTKPFAYSGGSVEVKHSIAVLDIQNRYVLAFGTRGRHSEPWCALAAMSSDRSTKDIYRELKLRRASF